MTATSATESNSSNCSSKTTSMKLQFLYRFAFKYALSTHLEWHQLEEKDLTKSRVEEGEVGKDLRIWHISLCPKTSHNVLKEKALKMPLVVDRLLSLSLSKRCGSGGTFKETACLKDAFGG